MDVNADEFWDALREQCCATKPHTDAKVIVMLRRDDVLAALERVADQHALFLDRLYSAPRKPLTTELVAAYKGYCDLQKSET